MSLSREKHIIDRIDYAFPPAWHIEAEAKPDHWQVWDSEGHIVAQTTGYDVDTLNDKACAALMACAPDMYGLLCMLHHEGCLPKKSLNGINLLKRWQRILFRMDRMYYAENY